MLVGRCLGWFVVSSVFIHADIALGTPDTYFFIAHLAAPDPDSTVGRGHTSPLDAARLCKRPKGIPSVS